MTKQSKVKTSKVEGRRARFTACGFALITVVLTSQGFSEIPGMCEAADRTVPAAAQKPRVRLANNDVEHLLYLADDRLVVIRMHLQVNGNSYRSVWKTMIDRYFKELDTNKDGVLTGKELSVIPTQAEVMRSNAIRTQQASRRLPTVSRNSADTNPRDGKVTRQELRDYLRRIGIRPFSVYTTQGSVNARFSSVYRQSNPNEAGQKLFDRLDTDNDGKLSRAELLAASKSLRKSDLDDDGLISTAELQGPSSPYVYIANRNQRTRGVSSGFLSLSSDTTESRIVEQIIGKYDRRPADGKLTPVELGLSAKELAPHDADRDGALDRTELRRFLRKPPANIEVIVRLGSRERGRKVIELVNVAPGLKSRVKQVTAQLANLSLKNSQVDISTGGNSGSWSFNSTQAYDQQFAAADSDGNGYLDRNEARRYSTFANTFDAMDADKDGKVFKKEMHAYFRRQESLTNSQTVLTISSQGRDLFKILDLNRDGRLSAAELEAAVRRIDAWDKNGDGQIAKAEIPRQYRLELGRGQVNNGFGGIVVAAPAYSMRGGRRVGPTQGPRWFLRMDLNGDGEVSRREFLGPPTLFQKLDRNGNGRIDLQEATAAQAATDGSSGKSR